MSEKTQVLFIGGMPRSGSTLFDLMLGQLPRYCDVGELFYMWSSGVARNELCSCGVHFHECAFWSAVGRQAFGSWSDVDVERVLDLQALVDTTTRLMAGTVTKSSRQRELTREYLSYLDPLYAAIAGESGAQVVVDSTKRPSTAYLLAESDRIDLRVAQLVRDPRGVVNAWSREVPIPEGTGPRPYLKKRPMRRTLRRWITVNAMFGRLASRGVPSLLIRYEDLVSDPIPWLRQTAELSGVALPADGLSFVQDGEVRRAPSHTATGGRVRMSTQPLTLRLDEKWRHELPTWRQQVVRTVAWPQMRTYGYS